MTIHVDNTVYTGRPSPEGREEREMRVYDLLERLGIGFMRADHEPAATVECLEAVDRALGIKICKNLFLCNAQKTSFYLLMMPGDKAFRTKDLSKQIGSSRLSFADAENMERLLDLKPGAVSVLGLMNDRERRVRLLIDRDILSQDRVGCHPCVNTSSLSILMSDLLGKFLPHTGHEPVYVTL
jgi:Ala-tRNA(Pro) deacylase